ncbi:MAG: hypothetical protein RBR84_04450 [Bacteroidales bacterium]|jgi:hypothetical protein|nr:hypothetical protein [Bacteroidales bacterium]MDD4087069.1 hypothetical protein [Bacteroidales bacterium]MDY0085148.1 hypothetical protein [Bacteroidales bacterium]
MKRFFVSLSVLILLLSLILTGCSPKTIVFTQQIRQKVESDSLNINEVQFYNSHPIVLQRNLTYDETKIASGEIQFENGRYIELIQIKKGTPGVCENATHNSLDVSFEAGDNRTLKFMMTPGKNYQISAIEWKDRFGKVTYDSLTYYLKPGSEKAFLKVKKDHFFKLDKKERIASGRKVTSTREN